jgi:hypothetical protein
MKSFTQPILPPIAQLLITIGLVSLPASASLRAAPQSPASSCPPAWVPTFGGQPGLGATTALALATFDDGSGPALYAGGDFTSADAVPANRIAKWNGATWSALASGTNDTVETLAVFDDGSGPALYAGGLFTTAGGAAANRIAKWSGASWSALGSGMNGDVYVLKVLDVGSGPALYAGGDFTSAGGVAANRIAKWNGASWTALAGGTNNRVRTLAVYNDGSGPALYAGGDFTSAGGVAANGVAKWNGSSWTALSSGLNNRVRALAVFDGGGGPELCAAGSFTTAGGAAANRIAKWNGASWSALGTGMDSEVVALSVFDDGSGAALCAGGSFGSAGGVTAKAIAKWNGASWSALGTGMSIAFGGFGVPASVQALASWDSGSGPALYAGGDFMSAGGTAANRIARWQGASWSALGGGGVSDLVDTFATYDDGSGPALYAAGSFTSAGGVAANRVAKRAGTSWFPLGSGLQNVDGTGTVKGLAVFDDGSGPALYAGGLFTLAGGVSAPHMARWNGGSWSSVGGGVDHGVFALIVFDDGGGPALYAGGNFTLVDWTIGSGTPAPGIAKWNGTSWSALGTGMNSTVEAFAAFDDGTGAALYAGGAFKTAGGVTVNRIAKWNGTSWSAVGGGMDITAGSNVHALAVYDDGSGPALYAGGGFTLAGGVPAAHIARWNGASWSAVGGGTSDNVSALTVYDDGSGPALYAGGDFETAGGVPVHGIARWDGTSWSALGAGMLGVSALAGYDDGGGPVLYAGGTFETSPAGDSYFARWACPAITSLPGCAGNPAVLSALASSAPLGAVLPLQVTGSAAHSGVSVVYFGASGVDGSGCGLSVPGIGELLLALAPPPALVASALLAGGISSFAPLIPNQPGLAGVTVYLQGAAVDGSLAQPIEVTNALSVKLGP